MKKQILHAYRVLVPDAVKRRIPARFKASALGAAYALTGYPDLRLWQMRHLYKAGLGGWKTKNIADPLFSCNITPARDGSVGTERDAPGRFFVEFGFLGLKVKGQLTDRDAVAAGQVELRLDGHLLRHIGIMADQSGRARILFTVRRPALDMFPRRGRLSLHDVTGRALTVDQRYFPTEQTTQPSTQIELAVPFGNGRIFGHLAATGQLDKKGWPQPTDAQVQVRQQQMLELYSRVQRVFAQEFNRPLFLLYGTLLGQVREGDFIPGDDDFDVGYVTEARTPAAIKAEAVAIMEKLVARGFIVSLNHLGRPHRIRDALSGGPEIHLDNHIIFTPGDGHVWLHPRAKLPLTLDSFRTVEEVTMRGVEVLRPVGAEKFLAAHYGPDWRVPDPGYINIVTAQDREVAQRLAALYLTRAEQRAFARRLAKAGLAGDFIAAALEDPYPIQRWADRVGF